MDCPLTNFIDLDYYLNTQWSIVPIDPQLTRTLRRYRSLFPTRDTTSTKNLGWQAKLAPLVRKGLTDLPKTVPTTRASLPTVDFCKKVYCIPLKWGKILSESVDKTQELDEWFRRLSHFSTLFKRQDPAVRYFLLPKPYTLNVKESQNIFLSDAVISNKISFLY